MMQIFPSKKIDLFFLKIKQYPVAIKSPIPFTKIQSISLPSHPPFQLAITIFNYFLIQILSPEFQFKNPTSREKKCNETVSITPPLHGDTVFSKRKKNSEGVKK